MASEASDALHELLQPTWWDNILHYGLLVGAFFQLIAIAAIVFLPPKSDEEGEGEEKEGDEVREEGSREATGGQPARAQGGGKKGKKGARKRK